MTKRGSLDARLSRLEATGAGGECQTCHGRSGPIGVYVEGEDGIRINGRLTRMPGKARRGHGEAPYADDRTARRGMTLAES